MPRPVIRDGQYDFRGGLNTVDSVESLRPNEVSVATNARVFLSGAIGARGPTQRTSVNALVTPAGFGICGGYGWFDGTETRQLVIAENGGLGRLFTSPAVTETAMTWTAQGAAGDFAATPPIGFAAFRDGSANVCYIADGGALNKWNGTALSLNIAGTPNVNALAVYNLRLFGVTGADQTLYWSAIGNGDSLGNAGASGGSAVVRAFEGQNLIGLAPIGASLMLFHRRGISRFTGWGQDDISIDSGTRGISPDVGAIFPNSICVCENVGYFVSDKGVYMVTEAGPTLISTKIFNTRLADTISFNDIYAVVACPHRQFNEVLFAFPSLGIYAYNYVLRCWYGPWTGIYTTGPAAPVTSAMWESKAQLSNFSDEPLRVLFGSTDGRVRHMDRFSVHYTNQDDKLSDGTGGSSFTTTIKLHRLTFGNQWIEKALRFFFVSISEGAASLSGSSAASLSWTMRGDQTSYSGTIPAQASGGSITDPAVVQPVRIHANGSGPIVDVTLTHVGGTEFVLRSIEAVGFNMGARY